MTPFDTASRQRARQLLRIALLVFGGQVLLLYVVHWVYQSGSGVISTFFESYDFVYFYNGARAWRDGHNPYTSHGFVTPPLSLLIPRALSGLTMSQATRCFLWLNLLLAPVALWWQARRLELPARELTMFGAVVFLFISTHESIRGGNMDALMLVLLIAAFAARRKAAGAAALATSIGLKVYSVILLPVLLRRRQWRYAGMASGWLLLMMLPFVRLWSSALHALLTRDARFLQMSIAPPTLFFTFAGDVTPFDRRLCLLFWLASFAVVLWRDRNRDLGPLTAARYVPWMLAWPALVFSYEGILALLVLIALVATALRRPLRWAEYGIFTGFLLLGIHVEHVTELLPLTAEDYVSARNHAAAVQAIGVVLMMVCTCLGTGKDEAAEIAGGENLSEEKNTVWR